MTGFMAAAAIVGGYLVGSFPTGVIAGRLRGVDIRKVGSGNIGATNAARTLGKKVGAAVLLVDAAKGYLPVLAARVAWLDEPGGALVVALVGLAAVAGHMFPPWLRFRGGKGVATAFGVYLALAPAIAGLALLLWVLVYALSRISSVGSLVAATALPVALVVSGAPTAFVALGAAMWVAIVLKHLPNIRRLVRHEESKV